MRLSLILIIVLLLPFSYVPRVHAQTTFTTNLSFGSSGIQVLKLQKILNQDPATQVATTGLGSPGSESDYFGSLTKIAVIKFQEKYAREILTPVGLTRGNGRIGAYTRMKLNALSASPTTPTPVTTTVAPASTPVTTSSSADYFVKESEKIDVYAGDAMLKRAQNKIITAINAAVSAETASSITLPSLSPTEVPSVAIGTIAPQSGTPGTRVSMSGMGISENSVVYFGSDYIVRTVSLNSFGNFSFIVPPVPPGRYDLAVSTNGAISSTVSFVITDPKNPSVSIKNISPTTTSYNSTVTINGSGFTPTNNVVVTTYQTFSNIPSSDGKTLTITLAPEILRESARVGPGTEKVQMSVYVVNNNGFSTEKIITMTL